MNEGLDPAGGLLPEAGGDSIIGGGEMGRLVRARDWSQTPLGPIADWPPSLRTAVSLVLNSNFPIDLIWGPQHTQIYNDGYWPICGLKHPGSLGQDFSECWASAFPVIGDAFRSALAGTTAFLEDQRMFLDRLGYLEETFFTFSFSPIRDEHGAIAGLFHPVTETTGKMLGQRRTRTLRDLTAIGLEPQPLEATLKRCAAVLVEAAFDVPFALFYQLADDGRSVHLVAECGLEPGGPASPRTAALTSGDSSWPFVQAATSGQTEQVDDLAGRFPGLVAGPYPEPPATARVLPIRQPGAERPLGLMIVGCSPRLPLNEAYVSFLELLGGTVSHVVASALAAEAKRRQAEALAEIDRAKTAFFANISHEFRTPLTLMLDPLETALGQEPPGPQHERLAIAHRNSLRLLKLVNNLLDFSRLEAGRAQPNLRPTDLAVLTADLASMFRSAIETAGLTLTVECPALPEPVSVDREMWEKIVLNLLSNAFKHTFTGGIRVALAVAGDKVKLTVADTGVGVPSAELPRLFERFHRVKGARARTHEGSGIGLALVQELLQIHGGGIEATSQEGTGSTFTATLPVARAPLPVRHGETPDAAATPVRMAPALVEETRQWLAESADGNAAEPLPAGTGVRPRIVWADDNADMRDYVRCLLAEHFEVAAFANGAQALAAARAEPPDLVLTDIMMPELDGLGLLRELRADERTRQVPVILLSARAGEEAIGNLEAGADDYLTKPFAARELLARVRTHLGLAKLRREWAQEQKRSAELERSEQEGRQRLDTAVETRRAMLGMLEDLQLAEQAMCASRETLRVTLEAAQIGHWELNLRTWEIGRSAQYDRIFGFEELQPRWTYQHFFARLHPDDRVRTNALFRESIAQRTDLDLECRIERADGAVRWLWVHGHVSLGAAGEPEQMLGMISDITARKEGEEARRASDARYRKLFENAPDGILIADRDGVYLDANASICRMLGYSCEQLVGLRTSDIVVPEEIPHLSSALRSIDEEGGHHQEWQLRRRDGTAFPAEVMATRLPDGNLLGMIRDVSERRQAEEALREKDRLLHETDRRLAEIVHGMAEACFALDREWRFVFVNGQAERLLRHNRAQLLGNSIWVAFSWLVGTPVEAHYRRVMSERLPVAFEVFSTFLQRWLEIRLFPTAEGVAAFLHDIQARKETEAQIQQLNSELEQRVAERTAELEAANRELEAFSYSVSHDLRAPLRAVDGFSRALQEDFGAQLPPAAGRFLDIIRSEAQGMGQLIDDLLAFSRLSRAPLRRRSVATAALVEGVLLELEPQQKGRKIDLQVGELAPCEGDPALLKQVWVNLLSNAFKYTQKREQARIEIGCQPGEPGMSATYFVRDNGAGFDMAYAGKLFGVFQRLHSHDDYEGTGVGLAIVQRIVHRHGGRIWAEAAPERGATFFFTLTAHAS